MHAVGRGSVQIAVIVDEFDAQGLQHLQMKVDLAGADVAAAGHGNARMAETADERAQNRDARAHLGHKLVRGFVAGGLGGIDEQGFARALNRATQGADDLGHDVHVGDAGHVVQGGFALAQNSGGNKLESRVFGTTNTHRTRKVLGLMRNDDFLGHTRPPLCFPIAFPLYKDAPHPLRLCARTQKIQPDFSWKSKRKRDPEGSL